MDRVVLVGYTILILLITFVFSGVVYYSSLYYTEDESVINNAFSVTKEELIEEQKLLKGFLNSKHTEEYKKAGLRERYCIVSKQIENYK